MTVSKYRQLGGMMQVLLLILVLEIVFINSTSATDFIAGYHLDAHCLILNVELKNEAGSLKDFDKLTETEIATVYHEMWHAWYLEYEKPRLGDFSKRISSRSQQMYGEHPDDKREEIYEEAVGDYIDAVIGTYMQTRRFLDSKTAQRREEIRSKTNYLKNTYSRLFKDKYEGYYLQGLQTKDGNGEAESDIDLSLDASSQSTTGSLLAVSDIQDAEKVLGEFIEKCQDSGLPTKYLKQAMQNIQGVVWLETGDDGIAADVVFAQGQLSAEDIEVINHLLFENILTTSTQAVFAESRFMHGAGAMLTNKSNNEM